MKKNIINFILILVICILAGCQQRQTNNSNRNTKSILSTAAGLIEYLRPLPAVRDVSLWQSKYGDGLIIITDHYKIYTTLLEPLMLKQVPAFVEAAYRGYQSQLPYPIETQIKFDVYLFADRGQWENFTKTFTGRHWPMYMKIKKGAYYLNGSCVAYNIGRSKTFSVLGHEGWHQFCGRHFKYRLPSWLDEGIAQLFETSKYDRSNFIFTPGKNYGRLGALKIILRGNQMIPLKELIMLNPGQVVLDDPKNKSVMAFYAQSYALVRFLREDNYGIRLSQYHQMLLGALNGTWPLDKDEARIAADRNIPLTIRWNSYIGSKLFDIYIKDDFEQVEQQYYQFCNKLVYHLRLR
jgi:hypothetical protein